MKCHIQEGRGRKQGRRGTPGPHMRGLEAQDSVRLCLERKAMSNASALDVKGETEQVTPGLFPPHLGENGELGMFGVKMERSVLTH